MLIELVYLKMFLKEGLIWVWSDIKKMKGWKWSHFVDQHMKKRIPFNRERTVQGTSLQNALDQQQLQKSHPSKYC